MSILTPNPSTALRQNHSSTPPHINLPPILTQNPSINPGPESVLHPPHLNLSPPLQQNPSTNPDLSLPVKVFSVQTMPPLQPLPHPYSRQEDISKPPSTFCDQHFRTEAGIQVMSGAKCKVGSSFNDSYVKFLPTRPLWAELVIELPCPSVCLCAPSDAVLFEASHWPRDHMISSRPLIGEPPSPPTPPAPLEDKK